MVEITGSRLEFSFPDVHKDARLDISFQRTLRIPDDGRDYPLPPGLGPFPIKHVDDHADTVPKEWLRRGGVLLPMYQSEAMWIRFEAPRIGDRGTAYPFAVRIAAGKVCAVSGNKWAKGLKGSPQSYVVVPGQPWLDGFVVEKGRIRQFVAMPLGGGYSVEEQITGKAEFGGLQVQVYPMKPDVFERRFPKIERTAHRAGFSGTVGAPPAPGMSATESAPMGLGAGGSMKQEVYDDPFGLGDWDRRSTSRVFVHLTNSMVWRAITGEEPPTVPPTAYEYSRAGLPWFDYYDERQTAIEATKTLKGIKRVKVVRDSENEAPLPENNSVDNTEVVNLSPGNRKVREW